MKLPYAQSGPLGPSNPVLSTLTGSGSPESQAKAFPRTRYLSSFNWTCWELNLGNVYMQSMCSSTDLWLQSFSMIIVVLHIHLLACSSVIRMWKQQCSVEVTPVSAAWNVLWHQCCLGLSSEQLTIKAILEERKLLFVWQGEGVSPVTFFYTD